MERIDTSFTAYKLTVEELASARDLRPEQRAYLQTLCADAAEEKLSVRFDPENPLQFAQQEAYLRGQIDILNMLLSSGDNVSRPKDSAETINPSI